MDNETINRRLAMALEEEMSAKMSRATPTAPTESAKTGAENVTTIGSAEGGE